MYRCVRGSLCLSYPLISFPLSEIFLTLTRSNCSTHDPLLIIYESDFIFQGDLRVTDIALGGPAGTSNAFKRGDIIAVIGGRNVRGMSVVQAKDLIMGPVGSKVVLGVHRENAPFRGGAQSGPGEFFEVTLIRAGHVPAARDTSIPRYSQSPMVQNRPGAPNLLTPSPFANRGRQMGGSDYQGTPGSEPARKPPVQVNEAMCGIGVFIESSANGLLTIKHVTPDGPASHVSEVQTGDFLVAIDGLTTLGMPMHQVIFYLENVLFKQ